DKRAARPILDDDLADTESLEPLDRRLRTGIAPEHGFVIIGGKRNVNALERLHENGAAAGEIAPPVAGTEVAVEDDLCALLAGHLDKREETADPRVGIERERDPGEIDELCFEQGLAEGSPFRQFEKLARRRFAAPIIEMAPAISVALDHVEPRQPPRHPA